MTPDQSILIAAAEVRRALVQPGDIRGEVEFQNDINSLVARIDDGVTLDVATEAAEAAPAAPVRALRVVPSIAGQGRAGAQPPPFRFKMTG